MQKKIIGVGVLVTLMGCGVVSHQKSKSLEEYSATLESIKDLFKHAPEGIIVQTQQLIQEANERIAVIMAIPIDERTFVNTIEAFDTAIAHIKIWSSVLTTLRFLSPDKKLREIAAHQSMNLDKVITDLFGQNKQLYRSLKEYVDGNGVRAPLEEDQHFFIRETIDWYKRSGIDLPDDVREQIANINKELTELTTEFETNINNDNSFLEVTRDQLAGLEEDFIEQLPVTAQGLYKVGTDYPTYFRIIEECSIATTREKLYVLMHNKAYPENRLILEKIIALRNQLAQLIGFANFAHLDIDQKMAKTPERVQVFIDTLLHKAQEKDSAEFLLFTKNLPESVILSPEGKLYVWDISFVKQQYKKNIYNFDEQRIAQYFSLEQTLEGLFKIYESFFDISITQESVTDLWHQDVLLLKVFSNKNNELIGYIFLDLHPRENKYGHACQISIVPALHRYEKLFPAVAVVVANFPKPTEHKPSLLARQDVSTFFHEFGHALHTIFGATRLASESGTSVKQDFVEMPSQMLEYWLQDREILKLISKHYITGEKLSDKDVDTIIELKNFATGSWLVRQLYLAQLALHYFQSNDKKTIDEITHMLHMRSLQHIEFEPRIHIESSFGHLMGYGACYYSYAWSQVFAADLFYAIKSVGLLNPIIGTKYAQMILAPGGSVDPEELLYSFLGREPNQEAYLKDMGL